MVGKKISDFESDNKITGTELIYAVDDNTDVKLSTQQIKDFAIAELALSKADKSEIIQGQYEFGTYAEFDAYKSNLPLNCTVVIGEKNTTGTGLWDIGNNRWSGSNLVKSEYDPTQIVLKKADETIQNFKSEIIVKSSNLFNDATSVKENKVIGVDGSINVSTNSTDFAYSDFISVQSGQSYYYDGFRYVAYYDANKNFISRQDVSAFGSSPTKYYGSYVTPVNAAYIRVVYRTTLIEHIDIGRKINKGENVPYEPFYEKLKEGIEVEKSDAWVFGSKNIEDDAISIDKVDFIEKSANLFNHETATSGYIISETGAINASASYSYSDFIEVEPLTQYTVSGGRVAVEGASTGSAFVTIAYYDFDKNFISRGASSNEDGLPHTITTPNNARFVRLNINAGLPNQYNRMLNKGSAALPYEPFSEPKIDVPLSDDVESQVVEKVLQQIVIPEDEFSKHIQKSTNLFNINSAIFDNKVINIEGVLNTSTTSADWARSDFISVQSGQSYYYDGFRYVAYYDANKNFISRLSVANFGANPTKYYGSYATPATAKYVVLCFRSTLKEHEDEIGRKMNFGSESLEYEAFGDKFSITLASDVIQQINEEAALKNESNLIQIDLPINGVYKTDAEWTEFSNFRTVTSAQVYQMYDDLTAAHSSYITKQNLGTDTLGNEISLYKFKPTVPSVPTKSKMAKVFILCGQHGMEHSPPLATYLMLREMCNNWQSNELIEALRFNVEFLVIPVLNPDGWNKYTRVNENGVDLNRNWPANWSYTGEGTELWSGPSAASELGVQYVMQVFEENKDIDVFMDFHNFNGTAAETQMLWVSPQTDDALVAAMARSLVTRMTRHWRGKYAFIPPEPYFAGRVAGGSGAMAKSYAASVGVPLSATFEVCGKWWLDPAAEQHDTIHKRSTMEALTNWVLINLSELQKR